MITPTKEVLMSFEGYYQLICENGHYQTEDVNHFQEHIHTLRCDACCAPFAWNNIVDDTNCDSYGYVKIDDFVMHPGSCTTKTERVPTNFETGEPSRIVTTTVTVHETYHVPPPGTQRYCTRPSRDAAAGCKFVPIPGDLTSD
jgi:hypothetical protein